MNKKYDLLERAANSLRESSKHKKEYSYSYKSKSSGMVIFERTHDAEYKKWLSLVNVESLHLPESKTPTFFYFANFLNDHPEVFVKFIVDNKLNKVDYLKYYKDRIKYIYSELAKKEVKEIKQDYKRKYLNRIDYIHNEYINNIKLSRKAIHEFLVREWPRKEKKMQIEIATVIYKYKDIIDYLVYTLRNNVNVAQGKSKLTVIPKYESRKAWKDSIREYREKLTEFYTNRQDQHLTKEYREANAARKREARLESAKKALIDTSNEAAEKQKIKINKTKKNHMVFIDKALEKLKKKKGV